MRDDILPPLDKERGRCEMVYIATQKFHIPRASYDAEKLLTRIEFQPAFPLGSFRYVYLYPYEFEEAEDRRPREAIIQSELAERNYFLADVIALNAGNILFSGDPTVPYNYILRIAAPRRT